MLDLMNYQEFKEESTNLVCPDCNKSNFKLNMYLSANKEKVLFMTCNNHCKEGTFYIKIKE